MVSSTDIFSHTLLQYTTFFAPDSQFRTRLSHPLIDSTASVDFPLSFERDLSLFVVPRASRIDHYDQKMVLCVPPLFAPTFLSIAARQDHNLTINGRLRYTAPSLPENREAAMQLGVEGPTREDYDDYVHRTCVRPFERCLKPSSDFTHTAQKRSCGHINTSSSFDADWSRITSVYDANTNGHKLQSLPFKVPPYVPGMFTGLWAGKYRVSANPLLFRCLCFPRPSSAVSQIHGVQSFSLR